jgi:hypothetical protein
MESQNGKYGERLGLYIEFSNLETSGPGMLLSMSSCTRHSKKIHSIAQHLPPKMMYGFRSQLLLCSTRVVCLMIEKTVWRLATRVRSTTLSHPRSIFRCTTSFTLSVSTIYTIVSSQYPIWSGVLLQLQQTQNPGKMQVFEHHPLVS